jgi:sugar lactone lactonase YvrE
MRFRIRLLVIALLTFSTAAAAQDTLPYEWQAGGISLRYPAHWDAPLPAEQNGQPALQLAQVLVDTPADVRPPAIPIITFTRLTGERPADGNLLPFVFAALQNLGIEPDGQPVETTLLGISVPELAGASLDGQLFGIARVAPLGSSDVLLVTGRSVAAQQDEFAAIFEIVANSASARGAAEVITDTAEEPAAYGIRWHTQRTSADGETGFLNLVGLAYGPDDHLYTYEPDLGVIQIDTAAGRVLSITPNENITQPTDLAVTSDQTIYVADTACGCIFTLTAAGVWLDQPGGEEPFDPETSSGIISGFGADAPAHIAVGPGDELYATSVTAAGAITVVVFADGERVREIRLPAEVVDQPLLSASPAGPIYALTQSGELLELHGSEAVEISTPGPAAGPINDLAITPEGNLAIATQSQGVLILTPEGDLIDQPGIIVPDFPLPGELVLPVGVAVDPQGNLYFADSDGTFGAITAMSTTINPDRLGSTELAAGLSVQGMLSDENPQQQWTYAGTAGERITITAIDNSGAVDVALRLFDPGGSELAFNDDHESQDLASFTDAQISDFTLPVPGQYTIVVEQISGEGSYSLGLSQTRALNLDTGGTVSVSGELSAVFPADVWVFSADPEHTLTITLETSSGDLDPLLRLVGPDESLIAENDDAEDTSLGTDAQLVDIVLPVSGTYRLYAARFSGSGSYNLTVVSEP